MSKLTPNQQTAVECAGRPLFIQAGAGTGKTFTLTKRLAYGLSTASGPLLDSVDNVLTITFTNKAAAELLGRVRAELRACGLSDAALQIDGAWISTIHSMCKSILSSHALEAGIDPGIALLTEEESSALLQQAVDEGLGTDEMEQLVAAFGPAEACALVSQLAQLLEMAPEGIASFDLGPELKSNPVRTMRALAESLQGHLESLEQLGVREEPSAACVKQTDRLERAIATAEELALHGDLSWNVIASEFESCAPPKGGSLKKVFREDFAQALALVADIRALAAAAQARYRLELALGLAGQAAARHQEMKRAAGVQDTNDLLMSTYRLLEAHPEIANEYRERFGSIMVDEFQDTDTLQVRIIESFCDEGLSTLTTVGDAQQSIYGFRGADLETYRSVRAQMADAGSQEVSLDTNYRSHPDILAFVESIFSKPAFFGDEFLRIGAGPTNAREYPWAPVGSPRATLMLAAGEKSPNGRSSTHAADLRRAEAELIAQRFEELARKGASWGQMAILMSSTKKAGPYLAALRSRGVPCAVSGGSDFYLQPEVLTMTSLLRVLELPDDDRPLLDVLASPLFDIPDGDLLALRVIAKRELRNPGPTDVRPKITLWDALEYQVQRLPVGDGDALVRAYATLSCACAHLGRRSLAAVLEDVLAQCGWLEELKRGGAQGLAVAANIERFCDLVAEFEAQQGPSSVLAGEHFQMMCDMAKEGSGAKGKPGRMVGLGNDSVQVMTIHASKGLEFPIVAVAQYARDNKRGPGASRAITLTQDGKRRMALPALYAGEGADDVKKRSAELAADVDSFDAAVDAAAFNGHAVSLSKEREDEEVQRLLYVALTRARDILLLVSSDKSFTTKQELEKGLFSDVADALFPAGFPVQGGTFGIDTGCLVECVVEPVPYDASSSDDEEDEAGELASRAVRRHVLPVRVQAPCLSHRRLKSSSGIASYSSLARERAGAGEAEQDAQDFRVVAAMLRARAKKQETVSTVGSAFHLVAQWVAMQPEPAQMSFESGLLAARIEGAARRYALDEQGLTRLREAVAAWLGSELCARTCAFGQRLPEHAFCVDVDGQCVEGFIDLLCLDSSARSALVVDYKTGVGAEDEELRERYALQAAVYAYAVLTTGAVDEVELVFVHPELRLREIRYAYTRSELPVLRELICR